jgi:hypothetical protein
VGGYAQISNTLGQAWSTPFSGAAGTITLTTLTATQIVGTFSFSADSLIGNAHGTKVVTEGQFNMLLGGTLGTIPDQYGSRLSGTFGGNAFNGATVVVTLLSNTLVIAANNTNYSLGIGKTSFAGVGTYDVGTDPGDVIVTMQGPAANPTGPVNCCWSTGVGTTGTLTVTSLTATRIKGSVSATLTPNPGTTASAPLDVSATFDIGIQ